MHIWRVPGLIIHAIYIGCQAWLGTINIWHIAALSNPASHLCPHQSQDYQPNIWALAKLNEKWSCIAIQVAVPTSLNRLALVMENLSVPLPSQVKSEKIILPKSVVSIVVPSESKENQRQFDNNTYWPNLELLLKFESMLYYSCVNKENLVLVSYQSEHTPNHIKNPLDFMHNIVKGFIIYVTQTKTTWEWRRI